MVRRRGEGEEGEEEVLAEAEAEVDRWTNGRPAGRPARYISYAVAERRALPLAPCAIYARHVAPHLQWNKFASSDGSAGRSYPPSSFRSLSLPRREEEREARESRPPSSPFESYAILRSRKN